MTLDILHEQGGVKVGTRISPTKGSRKQFSSLIGATITKIERWWVTVHTHDGGIARIYVQQKGVLDRTRLMQFFEVAEGQSS